MMTDATAAATTTEPHDGNLARRLNWLRAGVLGHIGQQRLGGTQQHGLLGEIGLPGAVLGERHGEFIAARTGLFRGALT